ncbi:MAG: M4 family metallopeptidase [Methanomicrobiales archaeon]
MATREPFDRSARSGVGNMESGNRRSTTGVDRAREAAIRGILPPHMLKHLAESRDPDARSLGIRMLMRIEKIRGMRRALGQFYVAPPGGARCIRVYDVKHGSDSDLPGDPVANPARSRDPEAKEAYQGAVATYNFYKDIYGRNSIDDRGMCIDSSVHFETDYDNAGWDGKQMIYGDGDGVYFNRFTIAIDVIGHELTHGVTEYEAALEYHDQPGALNESMSDVFGTLVKQWKAKETVDAADWLIGEGLFTKKVKGKALRSMSAPGTAYDDPVLGKDPQPADMKHYVKTTEDEGGVHINSGIPNHAFYLTAMELGGYAWEKAGRIWYVTLRDALRPTNSFTTAAKRTYQVAGVLFGTGSEEQQAVRTGWTGVGVKVPK